MRILHINLELNAEYKNTLTGLLDYLLENSSGIIFLDSGCDKYQKYLKRFTEVQFNRNFSVVYLTDNHNLSVSCDNIFTYSTNFENIGGVLDEIVNIQKSRTNNLSNVSQLEVDKFLDLLMREFNIPTHLTGCEYIKECVKVFLVSRNKKYNILSEAYSIVAEKYNKKISNIEKSIRLAISNAITINKNPFVDEFKNIKLSNAVFINYLVNKIKIMNCEMR